MKLYKRLIDVDIKTESNDKIKTIERFYTLYTHPLVEFDKDKKQKSINLKDWTCVAVLSDYRKEPNSTLPKFLIETEIWINDKYVNAEKTPYWQILKQSVSDDGGEIEIVDNISPDSKYKIISNWSKSGIGACSPINDSKIAESWFHCHEAYYQDKLEDDPNDVKIKCTNYKVDKELNDDGTIKSIYAKTENGKIIFGVELAK